MNSLRDFLKMAIKSITLTFWLVDVVCKEWTVFLEISFIKLNGIVDKYVKNVAASIPIHTDSDIYLHGVIHFLQNKNRGRGVKNHIYQTSTV